MIDKIQNVFSLIGSIYATLRYGWFAIIYIAKIATMRLKIRNLKKLEPFLNSLNYTYDLRYATHSKLSCNTNKLLLAIYIDSRFYLLNRIPVRTLVSNIDSPYITSY